MWKRSIQSLRSNKDDTGSALERSKEAVKGPLQWIKEDAEDETAAEKHDKNHPEHTDAVVNLQSSGWQKVPEDVAAIKRRDWDQVEDKEQQIEQNDVVKKESHRKELRKILRRDASEMVCERHRSRNRNSSSSDDVLDDDEKDERYSGRYQVAGRASE